MPRPKTPNKAFLLSNKPKTRQVAELKPNLMAEPNPTPTQVLTESEGANLNVGTLPASAATQSKTISMTQDQLMELLDNRDKKIREEVTNELRASFGDLPTSAVAVKPKQKSLERIFSHDTSVNVLPQVTLKDRYMTLPTNVEDYFRAIMPSGPVTFKSLSKTAETKMGVQNGAPIEINAFSPASYQLAVSTFGGFTVKHPNGTQETLQEYQLGILGKGQLVLGQQFVDTERKWDYMDMGPDSGGEYTITPSASERDFLTWVYLMSWKLNRDNVFGAAGSIMQKFGVLDHGKASRSAMARRKNEGSALMSLGALDVDTISSLCALAGLPTPPKAMPDREIMMTNSILEFCNEPTDDKASQARYDVLTERLAYCGSTSESGYVIIAAKVIGLVEAGKIEYMATSGIFTENGTEVYRIGYYESDLAKASIDFSKWAHTSGPDAKSALARINQLYSGV